MNSAAMLQKSLSHDYQEIPSIIGPALRSPMLGLQNVFLRKHSGEISQVF